MAFNLSIKKLLLFVAGILLWFPLVGMQHVKQRLKPLWVPTPWVPKVVYKHAALATLVDTAMCIALKKIARELDIPDERSSAEGEHEEEAQLAFKRLFLMVLHMGRWTLLRNLECSFFSCAVPVSQKQMYLYSCVTFMVCQFLTKCSTSASARVQQQKMARRFVYALGLALECYILQQLEDTMIGQREYGYARRILGRLGHDLAENLSTLLA